MASIKERIIAVTAHVLEIDSATIKPEHEFGADLGAESVQSVELVAMFEDEFGVDMDEDEALSVTTVAGAIEYITKVCQEQGVEV